MQPFFVFISTLNLLTAIYIVTSKFKGASLFPSSSHPSLCLETGNVTLVSKRLCLVTPRWIFKEEKLHTQNSSLFSLCSSFMDFFKSRTNEPTFTSTHAFLPRILHLLWGMSEAWLAGPAFLGGEQRSESNAWERERLRHNPIDWHVEATMKMNWAEQS